MSLFRPCLLTEAIALCCSMHTHSSLLAVGGKGGTAAIFGTRLHDVRSWMGIGQPETFLLILKHYFVILTTAFALQAADAHAVREPLRSAKLHRGWIADVRLISLGTGQLFGEKELPLLLSASNDGQLCLWNLQKSTSSGSPACLSSLTPHSGLFLAPPCCTITTLFSSCIVSRISPFPTSPSQNAT